MQTTTRLVCFVIALTVCSSVSAQPFTLPSEAPTPAAAPTRSAVAANGDPVIKPCQIDLVDDVKLPAPDAGVLIHLGVQEGDQVRSEGVIARIDDREPKQELRRAAFAYQSAYKKAKNDISVRFAAAQLEVARANLETLRAANEGVAKAVTDQEIREAELEVRSGELRVENSQHELDLADLDARTARVEVDNAQMLIDRRLILAPFDGEVVEVYRHQQEWVSPGDPILRLIRLDKLHVEGWVNVDQYSFAQLKGCEVTVDVPTAAGRTVKAAGRVVWVDPILMRMVDGQVAKIRAEIANRKEQGEWLVHPRRQATMTVHLGTGGVRAAARQ